MCLLITMGYQIELRHIRYFLVVADELHYRKAAERLFISQPGLSRQIKQLEEGVGIKLFERNNRNVVLTEAGKYLQKELSKNLKSIEATFNHAKLISKGKDGNLKFGYVGSAMKKIIPNLLIKLSQEYPKISFSLKEMDNQQQVESLVSQDIDIGFVRLERAPRNIQIQTILVEPFCLVIPNTHVINKTNFEGLHQFKDASFIMFDPKYSVSYYEKVMQIFDEHDFSPIVSHNTIHADSIYKLVENNIGVSIVPKSLTMDVYADVQFIELTKIPQKTALSVIWNNENRNPVLPIAMKLLKGFK